MRERCPGLQPLLPVLRLRAQWGRAAGDANCRDAFFNFSASHASAGTHSFTFFSLFFFGIAV